MPAATDPCQQLSEAIATIVSADTAVRSLTGRTTDNIARWRRRKAVAALPRLVYIAGPAEIAGGLGETYDVTVTVRAEAKTPTEANALLRAGVEALSAVAFEAANCDALVTDVTYDNPPTDPDDPSTDPNAVLAEAELVVNLTL